MKSQALQPFQFHPVDIHPQHRPLLVPVAEHDASAIAVSDVQVVDRRPMRMAVDQRVDAVACKGRLDRGRGRRR